MLTQHAAAQRYLPPSRYEGAGLPSPKLLYPDHGRPLYPSASAPEPLPYDQAAPAPDPVSAEPLGWPEPNILPVPTGAIAPVPVLPPVTAPMPAPIAGAVPSAPGLLPPPPTQHMPRFKSVATIESEGHTAPLDPEQLQHQPLKPLPFAVKPAPQQPIPILPESLPTPIPAVAAPAPQPIPVALAAPAPEPAPTLDSETKAILSRIPTGIGTPPIDSGKPTSLNRFDPDIEGVLKEEEGGVERHESMGVAIEVRRPKLDVTLELKNAYEALLGGQPQIALQIYKDILGQAPRHADALFGVATTYHRMGEPDLARPFYIKLLKLYPKHRDGLTNFLTLVAQEAPEEATARLEYLAQQNPNFGAIPALLGMLYDEMGKEDRAIQSLIRAVRMEPGNVAYKYNLAILYDKYGKTDDATVLYNQLLEAGRSGIALPAAMRDIQERVIFINTESSES